MPAGTYAGRPHGERHKTPARAHLCGRLQRAAVAVRYNKSKPSLPVPSLDAVGSSAVHLPATASHFDRERDAAVRTAPGGQQLAAIRAAAGPLRRAPRLAVSHSSARRAGLPGTREGRVKQQSAGGRASAQEQASTPERAVCCCGSCGSLQGGGAAARAQGAAHADALREAAPCTRHQHHDHRQHGAGEGIAFAAGNAMARSPAGSSCLVLFPPPARPTPPTHRPPLARTIRHPPCRASPSTAPSTRTWSTSPSSTPWRPTTGAATR